MGSVLSQRRRPARRVGGGRRGDSRVDACFGLMAAKHTPTRMSGWTYRPGPRRSSRSCRRSARLDPGGCDSFRAECMVLEAELAELDQYVREVIGSIPPDQRVLVTAHDAFGYFGRAYGLEVQGIQGISTESEAGLADMNRLVQRWSTGRSRRSSSNRASRRRTFALWWRVPPLKATR